MKDKIINHLIANGYSRAYAENLVLSFELELRRELQAEFLATYDRLKLKIMGSTITEPEQTQTYIKPEDMVRGEWYVGDSKINKNWLFKFASVHKGNMLITYKSFNNVDGFEYKNESKGSLRVKNIRPATKEEVLKYFPDEFNRNPIYGC